MKTQPTPTAAWPQAIATVTACEYDFAAGRALAFGIPTSKHFRISFNYWANDELHTGQFSSATAIPQGHLFPITYNPAAPHEHSKTSPTEAGKPPLFAIGITGSIILSLIWLAILRGCS
ncbi:MAG TPA: hypothetical protein VK627_05260 [Edaphobacter sp.]|nr:hypothetical protein [Edaphobacter sp.]